MGHNHFRETDFYAIVVSSDGQNYDWVLSATGRVSSVLLVLIAFFVFANVVSRFAGFPLPWLFDVTCFA